MMRVVKLIERIFDIFPDLHFYKFAIDYQQGNIYYRKNWYLFKIILRKKVIKN
tara:strand:- start:364 stop:522 length:159 start_codon:yes stop_codon:yes gene_type:complete